MNQTAKFGIGALFAISMLTTACGNMDDGTKTVAQGGVAGALLGGAIGYAIGGESGAIKGAAAGGALGLAYGSSVARKKAAYASEEQWLDACIASANKDYNSAVAYNNRLENDISQLETQIAQAQSARQKAAAKRQLQAKIKETDQQLAGMSQQLNDYNAGVQQAGTSAKAGQLRKRVTQFQSTERSIQSQKNYMASLQNQIDA